MLYIAVEENADAKQYHLSLLIQNISGLAVSIIAALYIAMVSYSWIIASLVFYLACV